MDKAENSSDISAITASLFTEEHNNKTATENCVRNTGGNSVEVMNGNSASSDTDATVAAVSGDNTSEAGAGERGGDLMNDSSSSATTTRSTQDVMNTAGDGGRGGNGGDVTAGRADSLTEVVNVTGRTMTRVVRN